MFLRKVSFQDKWLGLTSEAISERLQSIEFRSSFPYAFIQAPVRRQSEGSSYKQFND